MTTERVRGMNDILPEEIGWWQLVEQGPSTARWLTAGATTVAALFQSVSVLRGGSGPRNRLLRRFNSRASR